MLVFPAIDQAVHLCMPVQVCTKSAFLLTAYISQSEKDVDDCMYASKSDIFALRTSAGTQSDAQSLRLMSESLSV